MVDYTGTATAPIILGSNETYDWVTGPVEIIFPGATFQSRRALRAGDELLKIFSRDGSRTLIRRDDALGIVDLATDSFLPLPLQLPSDERPRVWFAAGGKVVLVQLKQDLYAFDARTSKSIWELPATVRIVPQDLGATDNSEFVEVATAANVMDRSNGLRVHYVNVWTGVRPKLSTRGFIRSAIGSPCGRYAFIWQTPREGTMQNATTGDVLWESQGRLAPLGVDELAFSDDGEELTGRVAVAGSKTSQARWKSATGEVLEAPPKGATAVDARKDQPPRYQVHPATPTPVEKFLDKWVTRVSFWLGRGALTTNEQKVSLFDTQSPGRLLGYITTTTAEYPNPHRADWLSGEDRVLVKTARTLNYYTIPPHRDWAKLALWCIVPPAVIAFILAVIRQVRVKFRPLDAPPAAAAPHQSTLTSTAS